MRGTARVLNTLKPEFINLMPIMAHPGSVYAMEMEKEMGMEQTDHYYLMK